MWRLSKLNIKGFKSFAEASELVFPEGITAVVGPNGCGKSNISDAIVWALGEQSTTALRARRMKDVIFQGSAGRKPTGFAEVTLYLTSREENGHPGSGLLFGDGNGAALTGNGSGNGAGGNGAAAHETTTNGAGSNGSGASGYGATGNGADGDGDASVSSTIQVEGDQPATLGDLDDLEIELAPDEETELSITRRIYRSGDSEYLMNGEKCLLREIREQLLGTGLGTRTCFTIEQGRIDQILSASPVERRQPIEEAAGISLYRRKRHTTKLKLEATAQDLARVEDICQEVARQMRSLKRQAGRAKRYRKLRDRLRRAERQFFSIRMLESKNALDIVGAALRAAKMAEESGRDELEAASRRWEKARSAAREQRQQEAKRRQKLYGAQVEHERHKSEASRQRDRRKFAVERREELEDKLEEIETRIEESADIVQVREKAADEAAAMATSARRAVREAQDQLDPLVHLDPAEADKEEDGERVLELHPLAARLQIDDETRAPLALALGRLLATPLVDDEDVDTWLQALSQRRGTGRALRRPGAVDIHSPPEGVEVLGGLADEIDGVDEEVASILRDLLGPTWLVEDARAVLELARRHPGHAFVDRAGSVWARGAEVRVRNDEMARQLFAESSRAVRRLEVPREPRPRQQEEEEQRARNAEIESARREVERAEGAHRTAQAQATAAERDAEAARAARKRLEAELERARQDITSLERTAAEAERRARVADGKAAEAAERCTALEEELQQDEVSDIAEEAELAGLEMAVAVARQRLERAQSRRSDFDVRAAELRVNKDHLHQQIRERLNAEPRELLERALAFARGEADSLVEDRAPAPEAADGGDGEAESERDEAGEPAQAESASPEQEQRTEGQERGGAKTGTEDGTGARRFPDLVELQKEISDARAAIDRLGPVNLVAYEDFKEQEGRFQDLDSQRRDLTEAASNLEKAIERIDRECVTRFHDAFEAIDGYFNRIFRQLFGGGRANMRLEDPDDPLNCGIEIVAQPPGKTLQSIRLMSGGERSLIALALMFAIFEYHPAPFCILDEADAALDDRNVGRFVQALHHFQDRAQFIMITHNKRSMEIADLLYGVTMEESGVSKLVSVSLN